MTDLTAQFTPLSYETVASLSPATRREMTLDFLKSGAAERALSMLPLIPFVSKGSWSLEYDRRLAGAVCVSAPPSSFPQVIQAIEAAHAGLAASTPGTSPLDFGDVFVQLCASLRSSIESGDEPQRLAQREKLRFLMEAPGLSLRSSLMASYDQAKAFAFIPRWLNNDNRISPSSVAFCLIREEPSIWAALWRRPEWAEQLDRSIYPKAEHLSRPEPGDIPLLSRSEAWLEHPGALGELLVRRLRETAPAEGQERPLVDAKVLALALFPHQLEGSMIAREGVWEAFGPKCYAMLLGREGGHAPRVEWEARRLYSAFERAHKACPLPQENEGFVRALFHGVSPNFFDSSVFREFIFSPDPARRQAFLANYAPIAAHGQTEPADPYKDVIAHTSLAMALYGAARSEDAETLLRVLNAAGADAIAAHPGARKGLDRSALMILASEASSPLFETALEWADARGALDECAEAKAWVMNEGNTRKKGDLLAHCVAIADLDKASALLARRPDFKMTSARDTARAMGSKLHSERAGRAVSAWETLLFSKTIALTPKEPDLVDLAQAPAPRRARL